MSLPSITFNKPTTKSSGKATNAIKLPSIITQAVTKVSKASTSPRTEYKPPTKRSSERPKSAKGKRTKTTKGGRKSKNNKKSRKNKKSRRNRSRSRRS